MTVRFRDFLNEQLQDEEFRAEYETLALEDSIMHSVVNAVKAKGFTQEQLSERTGISRQDIKALESGSADISIRTLIRLAEGINMKLLLKLSPA